MRARRPVLLGAPPAARVGAVVLLLPGGSISSRRRPLRLAEWGLARPARLLRGRDDVACYLVRYRYRGWYAGDEDGATAADARWAVHEAERKHPGAPVVLVGNSLGGRAAVAAAGHPAVTAVAGVAPWLPPDVGAAPLAGRRLLIVHGSADRSDAPALWSLAFAERARAAGVSTARFIIPADGHLLLRRQRDWATAVTAFAAAAAGLAQMPAPLRRGFDPAAPLSLPLPPAAEFATSD